MREVMSQLLGGAGAARYSARHSIAPTSRSIVAKGLRSPLELRTAGSGFFLYVLCGKEVINTSPQIRLN